MFGTHIAAEEIRTAPARIVAYPKDVKDQHLLDQASPQPEDELLILLVNRVKEYADLIASLGQKPPGPEIPNL